MVGKIGTISSEDSNYCIFYTNGNFKEVGIGYIETGTPTVDLTTATLPKVKTAKAYSKAERPTKGSWTVDLRDGLSIEKND